MGPQAPNVQSFVYGAPVTLSSGYSRAGTPNSPCSFAPLDMVGKVMPTALPEAETAVKKLATIAPIGSSFVYGAPVPASKGLLGFSNPTSFSVQ
jgi:hypothetical protein